MDKTFTLYDFLTSSHESDEPALNYLLSEYPAEDDHDGPGEDVIRFLMDYSRAFEVVASENSGSISCYSN